MIFAIQATILNIPEDPTRLVRRALCAPPPSNGLSADEETRLLDALTRGEGPQAERDHALFHLMLATGLRLSSAIALDRDDVDLERAEIEVQSTKGNRPNRVFLGAAMSCAACVVDPSATSKHRVRPVTVDDLIHNLG